MVLMTSNTPFLASAVTAVAPVVNRRCLAVHADRDTSTFVVGTTPEYLTVRDVLPLTGRFFNQADLNRAARVAVLGQTVVDSLGLDACSALGQTVRIQGEPFSVIGTLELKGVTSCRDMDDQVMIPRQLSGGQQQRVAIARALVNQPELLLADEPTGALDSRTGSEVMDLLADLHSRGLTIILVTHDASVAERTRRIVRIEDGRILP